MKAACLVMILLVALACGGGGGGESSSENGNSSSETNLRIKLVNADSDDRNKLVFFSDETPFRIFSDQTNRTDPTEATHARLRVYDDEYNLLREAQKAIERFDTEPYEVDPDSRFITITNLPGGNLIFEVDLGQDFGVTSSNTRNEVVYYTGSENVFMSGNTAIIDGESTSTIPITVKNVEDEERGLFTIQGYMDFVDFPIVVELEEDDIFSSSLTLPITTFNTIDFDYEASSNTNASYITNNIQIGELDEPLSYFFEILNISSNHISFSVASETGSPDNFVLRGYVSPSESKLGIPVLIDWETTWTKIMTDWFLFNYENVGITLPTDDYETNYNAMGNVFSFFQDFLLPPTTGNTFQDPYILNAEDLLLTEIAFIMFRTLNLGDKLSDTSDPSRFGVKIVSPSLSQTQGIENFFLSSGNNRLTRPLRVRLENSEETLDIPASPELSVILDENKQPILGSSDNLIIRDPQEGELTLIDEFADLVEETYNTDDLLFYLFEKMYE